MSENRKRNQTLSIRLTPAEKDAIVKQAAKARMSLTDYILTSALMTEIHVAEDIRRRFKSGHQLQTSVADCDGCLFLSMAES